MIVCADLQAGGFRGLRAYFAGVYSGLGCDAGRDDDPCGVFELAGGCDTIAVQVTEAIVVGLKTEKCQEALDMSLARRPPG